jgi:pimeloyl-ACP methyl ester carboxylesterase
MSAQCKPSIVLCHGLWADGWCFAKLITPLRDEGHEVITSQRGLDTHRGEVDCAVRTARRASGPVILVGPSYGGSIMMAAGSDDRVAGLVYISALAPDELETSQALQNMFPKTDVFSEVEVAHGRVW